MEFLNHPVVDALLFGAFDASFWLYAGYALVMTHITIAAVTIYLHRCQAHRSLDLHPAVAHFFRFWLWMTTSMVTREWAAVHRKHHAKTETDEDPHSPQIHGLASVLFLGVMHYIRARSDRETVERYGYGAPDDWLENNVYTPHCKWGIRLMAFVNIALFGVIPGMLVWAVQMVWIPFWAAGVINGVGHYWGYRNFQPQDESRNIVPLGLLIGGEELHNNHHAFPTSARLSNRWYEFDIGWLYISVLKKFGLAKVKRVAPKLLSSDSRANCDLDTLQSIITNRLEVISRFRLSVKKICASELNRVRRAGVSDAPAPGTLNNWLNGLEWRLTSANRREMGRLISNSQIVAKVDEMRRDLVSLWNDKSVSSEELVQRLREWCTRAENSGIAALANFAAELRGYRAAPAAV